MRSTLYVQKRLLFVFLLTAIFSLNLFAQERNITGVVSDETGNKLPGVTVIVKGTMNGTVTNIDGEYTLTIGKNDDVLLFTYMGMKDQEVEIAGRSRIDVTLTESVYGLDEVVAIGYATQRKGDVTSAIASVKAEDFSVGKISDAAELVKGKIAGLSIIKATGDPNSSSSIMLRGITTIKGSVSPLVLVDGIEGSLTTVAPENIASIDVLKDASAAAIYGTRGANGVILITTKSGKRNEAARATYSTYVSFSEWTNEAEFTDTHDVIYGRTSYEYEGFDTDWLKAVTRKAGYTQNHNLNLEGGTKSSTYSANVTYTDEEGIMRKSDRNDIKTQLDFSQYAMNDMLRFNVNMLYSTHKNTNNNNNYVYRQALIRNPSAPIYYEDGSYVEDFNRFQYYNPVEIQDELIGDTRSQYARITGNITLEPLKGWQTNLMLSRKEIESTSENYYTSKFYSQATANVRGSASKSSGNTRSDNLELTSKYNVDIDKGHLTALVGYSYL